jgi:hypothetical protein
MPSAIAQRRHQYLGVRGKTAEQRRGRDIEQRRAPGRAGGEA